MTKAKRSGHKKSTAGCANCKRKHIKCDETRPSCVNCITQGRRCPYQNETQSRTATVLTPATTSTDDSPIVHPSIATVASSPDLPTPAVQLNLPSEWFDLPHIELLQQWLTETHRSYTFNDEHTRLFGSAMFNYALAFPFLMHGILASAALHLSVKHPQKAMTYQQLAGELSVQALSEFNSILPELDERCIVPAFLFSNITSSYQMSKCFLTAMGSFEIFIERFVECMKIARGVTVVLHGWWPYLKDTELAPILTMSDRLEAEHDIDHLRPEFDDVRELIHSLAGVNSTAATETYLEAIQKLQRFLNVQCALDSPRLNETSSWAFAWPINATQELTALLEMKRPEALVILAHYAPLLHFRRSSWAVGQAGISMVQLVESALGPTWRNRLQWPRTAVGLV